MSPQHQTIEIGQRRLAATLQGSGPPYVLLEVGFGAEASSWSAVAEAVSRMARVCYYDRAGRGGSDADSVKPRGPDVLVEDAHAVIHAIDGVTPFVFVGQSFGGLIGRLLAHRYPNHVAGLVLVDSLHEDQFDTLAPLFPPASEGEPAMVSGMRSFWSGGWRDPAQNKEGIDMLACQAAAHAVTSLGDLPIHVLTASSFVHPPMFPRDHALRLQAKWEELQSRFTRLSTRAVQQVIPECGHFMQTDKPQVVVDAIEAMLAAIARA
jgi:pimeloyl-ACP methyl ester carboxylesterase